MQTLVAILICGFAVGTSNAGLSLEAYELFFLGPEQADIMYVNRPTPTLAVAPDGHIAFPTRKGQITVFNAGGEAVRVFRDQKLDFPVLLRFANSGALLALNPSETKIFEFQGDKSTVYPFSVERWFSLIDPEVWRVLEKRAIHLANSLGSAMAVQTGPDGCIYVCAGGVKKFCKGATPMQVSGTPPGRLVAVLPDGEFLLRDSTDCFLWNSRTKQETLLDDITVKSPALEPPPQMVPDNSGEMNKENTGTDWVWSSEGRALYEVTHAPNGFYFVRYDIVPKK